MNRPLNRIQTGVLVLAAVFALSVAAYRIVAGYSWLDAVWIVAITFSTVGYGEHSAVSPAEQVLAIVVIFAGVTAFAFTSSLVLQALVDGEFRRALGARKMKRQISELDQHVIVCGYGRLGQDLAQQLQRREIPFLVIDLNENYRELAESAGVLLVHGDATSEDVLNQVGIGRARSIVCALASDADNVFVALTARNLAPGIQIIARSEHASSCKKLRQAGADRIVMPHHTGAQQMERMISRPSTADLLELFSETSNLRVELDEFRIGEATPLAGKKIGDCTGPGDYGLIVVGVRNRAGDLLFNPPAGCELGVGDSLLVMGPMSDIVRFRQHFGL